MQLQACLTSDDRAWFLINASPDLRFQMEAHPELQPFPASGRRSTPVQGIVLTSADLDQVLGLLLLREFQPLTVYSTELVRQTLEANSFFRMLHRVPGQLTWIEIAPGVPFGLGEEVLCTPLGLPGSLPFYARGLENGDTSHACLGMVIQYKGNSESRSGLRIAYTPSLPDISDELLQVYDSCDAILIDGTFWSDAELSSTHSGTPSARSIGHLPMGGHDGSIARLAGVTRPRKVFIHLNNTNPVLDPRSPEHRQVLDAGWEIGHDGWQLTPQ